MSQTQARCNIPEEQNRERSLRLIAAWSWLYNRAKTMAGWQFALSVPFALAMSLVALRWPDAKVVTTPLALLFGWIDILWLDRIQARRKLAAARVQEQFDCELFNLPWNEIRGSALPESEESNEAADAFARNHSNSNHRNWYPPEVGRVPLPLARLICQRAAVWWDMAQRRKYAAWLMFVVGILVVMVIAISFAADQRVREMVFAVYIPVAPAVVWLVREYIRQVEAAAALEKLKTQIEKIFAEGISGRRGFQQLGLDSRTVQDMIFDGRSRNPLFFNFLYRRLRPVQELRMGEKAMEMVEEALTQQQKWRP